MQRSAYFLHYKNNKNLFNHIQMANNVFTSIFDVSRSSFAINISNSRDFNRKIICNKNLYITCSMVNKINRKF